MNEEVLEKLISVFDIYGSLIVKEATELMINNPTPEEFNKSLKDYQHQIISNCIIQILEN